MNKISNLLWVFFTALLVVLIYVYFTDENIVHLESYSCTNDDTPKCGWKREGTTIYSVDVDAQSVVSWTKKKPWPLVRHKDCIVKSVTHWTCIENLSYYKIVEDRPTKIVGLPISIGLNDGGFTRDPSMSKDFRFVTLKWWNPNSYTVKAW